MRDDTWHKDPELAAELAEEEAKYKEPLATTLWIDDDDWEEADIPRRPWVAEGYALRGAVTVVTGPPSVMKSMLMLAWASAVGLNREHGRFKPQGSGNVIVYNVEDNRDEQRRRLAATLRQFDATPADIKGKVVRTGPSEVGTLFIRDESDALVPTDAMQRLRWLIKTYRPAMLIADPLAELHTADENDNTAIRAVIAAFRSLAVEFNVAVVLIHHTRKGVLTPGDPDSARGASSLVGAARILQTLIEMSEKDAEMFGLPTDRKTRSRYARLDDGKQSYSSLENAVWYERVLCTLANGETVPASVPWAAPDMWKSIPTATACTIIDQIDAGLSDDAGPRRYTDDSGATVRAAWKVVTAKDLSAI
jgi:RecA-family ATPase